MSEGKPNGPTAKTTWTCDGCPLLHTEDWVFHEENDGVDRGTDATCGGADGRSIATYWHKGYPTPAWCPYPMPFARPALNPESTPTPTEDAAK